MCYSAVTIGSVIFVYVYCVWNDIFVCFRDFSKSSVSLFVVIVGGAVGGGFSCSV